MRCKAGQMYYFIFAQVDRIFSTEFRVLKNVYRKKKKHNRVKSQATLRIQNNIFIWYWIARNNRATIVHRVHEVFYYHPDANRLIFSFFFFRLHPDTLGSRLRRRTLVTSGRTYEGTAPLFGSAVQTPETPVSLFFATWNIIYRTNGSWVRHEKKKKHENKNTRKTNTVHNNIIV